MAHTKEGRREIIETQDLLAKRRVDVARLASEYKRRTGSLDGFDAYAAEWAEKNPLFKGREHVGSFTDRFGQGAVSQVKPGRYIWDPQKGLVGQ
jgi:hypothetical protein